MLALLVLQKADGFAIIQDEDISAYKDEPEAEDDVRALRVDE